MLSRFITKINFAQNGQNNRMTSDERNFSSAISARGNKTIVRVLKISCLDSFDDRIRQHD